MPTKPPREAAPAHAKAPWRKPEILLFAISMAVPGITLIAMAWLNVHLRSGLRGVLSSAAFDYTMLGITGLVLAGCCIACGGMLAIRQAPPGRRRGAWVKASLTMLAIQFVLCPLISGAFLFISRL
jgi:hypothetical protein